MRADCRQTLRSKWLQLRLPLACVMFWTDSVQSGSNKAEMCSSILTLFFRTLNVKEATVCRITGANLNSQYVSKEFLFGLSSTMTGELHWTFTLFLILHNETPTSILKGSHQLQCLLWLFKVCTLILTGTINYFTSQQRTHWLEWRLRAFSSALWEQCETCRPFNKWSPPFRTKAKN